MAGPKRKGDWRKDGAADEWLDDTRSSNRGRPTPKKKKPAGGKAVALDPELANATVAEVFPSLCRVRTDDGPGGGKEPLCAYRRANVLAHDTEVRERSPVAVGDRVRVKLFSDRDGVVDGVCARRNKIFRAAPDRDEGMVHVLAANLDLLVVVAAAHDPEFSPGLVDRFLVAAEAEGIPVVLAVNKIDLARGDPAGPKPWTMYRDAGAEIFELSAREEDGIAALAERLRGRVAAFCGHSGVGKTSLLRKLMKTEVGRVGDVSDATGKGRHTTTGAVLLVGGPEGSRLIDTPGVREFGLVGVEPGELKRFYPELARLPCAARGCEHLDEPDCDARELPRYASFRRIHDSLEAGER